MFSSRHSQAILYMQHSPRCCIGYIPHHTVARFVNSTYKSVPLGSTKICLPCDLLISRT